MKLKLRKFDVIIIVVLIIIAGGVFLKVGYIPNPIEEKTPKIEFIRNDEKNQLIVSSVSTEVLWEDINITGDCDKSFLTKYVHEGDIIDKCRGTISIRYIPKDIPLGTWSFKELEELPNSVLSGNERDVSPEDEGPHYQKALVAREWWYYSAVFGSDSDLAGWTLSVSFNHMSRNDLYIEKPDILVVTLISPDGEKYGGIVSRERPILGILRNPSLEASGSSKDFKVTFEDSYVKGRNPNWHLHVEGEDIDEKNDIIIDLQYFAPSSPYWTFSNAPFDKSNGNIASYIFTGCEISGTIKINGFSYSASGIGHHEHTWISGILSKRIFRGWDWCHMQLDNGWNIYYSNYYLLPQLKSIKESKINPFSNLIITTNQGETLTKLENVDIEITESDTLFLLLNIPISSRVNAGTSPTQVVLNSYEIKLDINIKAENTYDHTWKRLSYVGMKIGGCSVSGKISWIDDVEHEVELSGIGTIWNMRH
jgi:predicted secreted hydrolase